MRGQNRVMRRDWVGCLTDARTWLVNQPRLAKRLFLAANDFALLLFAAWLALSLQGAWADSWTCVVVLLSAPAAGCFFLWRLGLYRIATRFIRSGDAARMYLALGLAILAWALLVFMVGRVGPGLVEPHSIVLVYAALACAFVRASRWLAVWLLRGALPPRVSSDAPRSVAVYGTGPAGVRLLEALRESTRYAPVAFIDDSPSLIGQRVGGLKVYREAKIKRLIERHGLREVLLALPHRSRNEMLEIVRRLSTYPLCVRIMPSIDDIAFGRASVSDHVLVDAIDLLGREPVAPDAVLMARTIRDKCVMVTGAGGSIGSELARQIVRCRPRCLVLLDHAEAALYAIRTEIADWLDAGTAGSNAPEVVAVLGSILDRAMLERVMRRYGVQTVYHAAAYKHVAIVEDNAVAGLRNNTFGTAAVAKAAARQNVERAILVSTDKAVRPTSMMGASKRLAELIFQAYAVEHRGDVIFSIVRFGNVLDSSGSVVRRFRKQIEEGGPVTVTDRQATRFFMSIPEAAALVMQACAMAKGGEVFALDMGARINIEALARTMIRLTGRTVRDEGNPHGDIPISYIGLRPGEKRHEERPIGREAAATEHPRIWRNEEPHPTMDDLAAELARLEAVLPDGRVDVIQTVISRIIADYRPEPQTHTASDVWPALSRALH